MPRVSQSFSRRVVLRAVLVASPVVLLCLFHGSATNLFRSAWRWAFDPVYQGNARLACSSIKGAYTLQGPTDPAKVVYLTKSGMQNTPPDEPGAKLAYHCKVLIVDLAVMRDGTVKSTAFPISVAKFTGFMGSIRREREIKSVSGHIGFLNLKSSMLFAENANLVSHAYLLVDLDRKQPDWRVFEFAIDPNEPDVVIPDLTTLPTVAECPRGEAYWEAYQNAAEEDEGSALETQLRNSYDVELRERAVKR